MEKGAAGRRGEATLAGVNLTAKVLNRIAEEVGSVAGRDVDSHIKNDCDIHGKGSHIKGSGPNYLKTSDAVRPSLEDVMTRPLTQITMANFLDAIVERLVQDVRGRIG